MKEYRVKELTFLCLVGVKGVTCRELERELKVEIQKEMDGYWLLIPYGMHEFK